MSCGGNPTITQDIDPAHGILKWAQGLRTAAGFLRDLTRGSEKRKRVVIAWSFRIGWPEYISSDTIINDIKTIYCVLTTYRRYRRNYYSIIEPHKKNLLHILFGNYIPAIQSIGDAQRWIHCKINYGYYKKYPVAYNRVCSRINNILRLRRGGMTNLDWKVATTLLENMSNLLSQVSTNLSRLASNIRQGKYIPPQPVQPIDINKVIQQVKQQELTSMVSKFTSDVGSFAQEIKNFGNRIISSASSTQSFVQFLKSNNPNSMDSYINGRLIPMLNNLVTDLKNIPDEVLSSQARQVKQQAINIISQNYIPVLKNVSDIYRKVYEILVGA